MQPLIAAGIVALCVAGSPGSAPAGAWLEDGRASGQSDLAQTQAAQAIALEIDLAGPWRFALDRDDRGVAEQWYARQLPAQVQLRLPGSLQEQGQGDEISVDTPWTGSIVDRSWFTAPEYAPYRQPGNIKVPFWLQPARHYVGAAWYEREVEIPLSWQDRRVELLLERCHWETALWLDGREVGTRNSLSAPHVYELTKLATPGNHRLTLRVDNRLKIGVGINAHSVSDHTQTNWNGVVGRLVLRSTPRVWIEDVQVYPDLQHCHARIIASLGNVSGTPANAILQAAAACGEHRVEASSLPIVVPRQGRAAELILPLGAGARLWDEFSPHIYQLVVTLQADGAEHRRQLQFGMREFSTRGRQFTINGRPTFLRGTLECCIFPLTGYPPAQPEPWQRIFAVLKAHGLNHMRFHSWCPPEAAFVAADQAGVYLHVECAAWATIGDGQPVDQFIIEEAQRMLRAYGNHPSFCMMAYGNEPAGRNRQQFLARLVESWKAADPRRVYTSAAGWPIIAENQYHSTPQPRIHHWGAGLGCRLNAQPPETMSDYREFISRYEVPVVSHEIGQWCVYPNFEEIPKYTGVLQPKNFEIFRDFLRAHQMLDQAHDFLMASGKLQALCYKEEIEAALRTPQMGGFQLLDLHDFPGQGTALVGVLDPFWDSKGYITPAEFHRFSCETVLLARMPKRTWTTAETFEAAVELAHYGPKDLSPARPWWKVTDAAGRTVASGKLPEQEVPTGSLARLGSIRLPLGRFAVPERLTLEVGLDDTPYANGWAFWVYPQQVDLTVPKGLLLAERLDEQAVAHLRQGGRVLLLPASGTIKGDRFGKVPAAFSPIFWNTAWTRRQAPHTLGILCRPEHPALARFPTEYHSDWQWWDLVTNAQVMILDHMPPELRPIVQVIDDWFTARRLGLVFEARLAGGRLLVCSIDLRSDLDQRAAARQMLHSLLEYAASERFQPAVTLRPEQVQALFETP